MSTVFSQTSAAAFEINTDLLSQHIEESYGFKIARIKEFAKGYTNLSLIGEQGNKQYVLRFFGSNGQSVYLEAEISKHLYESKINTPKPYINKKGELVSYFGKYLYCIFDFVEKTDFAFSKITPEALALSISTFSNTLAEFKDDQLIKNRFFYDEKTFLNRINFVEENAKALENTSTEAQIQSFKEDIAILKELNLRNNAVLSPIHSDIFSNNLGIDKDGNLVFFDFEYIGIGQQILDLLSLIAWNFFTEEITDQNWDYFVAFFKKLGITNQYSAREIIDWMIYLNLIDSLFNWEKSVRLGSNSFQGYLDNHIGAKNIIKHAAKIEELLNAI